MAGLSLLGEYLAIFFCNCLGYKPGFAFEYLDFGRFGEYRTEHEADSLRHWSSDCFRVRGWWRFIVADRVSLPWYIQVV